MGTEAGRGEADRDEAEVTRTPSGRGHRASRALMRLDKIVHAAAWFDVSAVAVGGSAGLYLFGFLTDTDKPTAGGNVQCCGRRALAADRCGS
jgi:hypothetical protein